MVSDEEPTTQSANDYSVENFDLLGMDNSTDEIMKPENVPFVEQIQTVQ